MIRSMDTGLDNKKIAMNFIFVTVSFILNSLISFFITPYITSQLGSEAFGFVKLANDFAGYASLISIALNSMASRFIMLKREKNEISEGRKYFASITVANIIFSFIMLIPSVLCVGYIENMINVPAGLILDVKITFALTFATFLLSLFFSTQSICYYLCNRLDISSLYMAQSNVIRIFVMIGLFLFFHPRIIYICIGTLVASVFVIVANLYYTKTLTPDLIFDIKDFEWNKVKEIIASGVWNSITRLGQILTSGLDLLVTNLFIGSQVMGYFSVAKSIPNLFTAYNSMIAYSFSPNMMSLYAQKDMRQLKRATKSAMRFMCLFVAIPNAILLTMGKEFFMLWVPEQPAGFINILSILTVINSCVMGPLHPLNQIFTITNKVKQNSLIMITYGLTSILLTLLVLQVTDIGVFAVAGISLIGSLIVAFLYLLPFSAIHIGLPWYTFFPEIGISIVSFVISSLIGFIVNLFLPLEASWVMWFSGAMLDGCISLSINFLLVLKNEEREFLIYKIHSKFVKHG